ncbi:unnamed protein product [Lymnaea stagnalis]|uniref:Sushi domain-containing protein n=1 Tax=Lymnaea stagnalis TaxID=6523 RepID=A0AAV2HY88_LYMST
MVWNRSVHAPCGIALLVLSILCMSFVDGAILEQELEEGDNDKLEMKHCDFDPKLIISECYTVQEDGSLSRTIDPVLEDATILPEFTLCKSMLVGTEADFLICQGGKWTDYASGHREKRWGQRRQNTVTAGRCPSEYTTISNGRTRCVPATNPRLCCYYCDEGYERVGQQTIRCRNNVWGAPKPVCQVRSAPPVPVRCAPGSYSTSNGTCTPCARGYYQDRENMTTCIRCPDNKTTDSTGAASVNECYDNVEVPPV